MKKSDKKKHRQFRRTRQNQRSAAAGSYGQGRIADRQGNVEIIAEIARTKQE